MDMKDTIGSDTGTLATTADMNGNKNDNSLSGISLLGRSINYRIHKRSIFDIKKKIKARSADPSDIEKNSTLDDDTVLHILKDVDVFAPAGRTLAIMGASGSGKTSLLNVLSNRVNRRNPKNDILGDVYFGNTAHFMSQNGAFDASGSDSQKLQDCKYFSRYVMQKDYLMENLTVRESLDFAAKFRLKTLNRSERDIVVNNVINQLGLGICENTRIGGPRKRGISGGQMKRVCIGLEMLDNPGILFLDEPTTGLDSALAYDVMRSLLKLGKDGRTVICTIHQPRSQLFNLFDNLMLLNKGQVVYHGAANECQEYFAKIGFNCPNFFNPADFFLDLMTATGSDGEDIGESESRFSTNQQEIDLLPETYRKSNVYQKVLSQIDDLRDASEHANRCELNTPCANDSSTSKYSISKAHKNAHINSIGNWFICTTAVFKRTFVNTLRSPTDFIGRLCVQIFLALFLGGVFLDSMSEMDPGDDPPGQPANFYNLVIVGSAAYFPIIGFSFSAFDALLSFQAERLIFNRENFANMYGASSFFIGKTAADMLFHHLPATFFMITFFFLAGFRQTFASFLIYILIGNVCVFASVSFFYVISAITPDFVIANIIAPCLLVIFMTTGGFYVKPDGLPGWINWMKYISWFFYSYSAILINDFPPDEFTGTTSNADILQGGFGISNQGLWQYILATFAIGVIYRILAYIAVRFCQRKIGIE